MKERIAADVGVGIMVGSATLQYLTPYLTALALILGIVWYGIEIWESHTRETAWQKALTLVSVIASKVWAVITRSRG